MRTELLAKLYKEFEIDNLPLEQHGKTSDRLGKLAAERYILEILKISKLWFSIAILFYILKKLRSLMIFLEASNIYLEDISDVYSGDDNLGRTIAGGLPKKMLTSLFSYMMAQKH